MLACTISGGGQGPNRTANRPSQPLSQAIARFLPADILGAVFVESPAQLKAGLAQSKFPRIVNTKAKDVALLQYTRAVSELAIPSRFVRMAIVFVEPQTVSSEAVVAAVVAEVQQPTLLDQAFGLLSRRFVPSTSRIVERDQVKITITDQMLNGESLAFAKVERFLVFGQLPAVEKILSSAPQSSKLAQSAHFRLVPQPDRIGALFTYLNLERLSNLVLARLVSRSRGGAVSIIVPALQFVGFSALKTLSFSTTFSNGVGVDTGHLIVDSEQKGLVATLANIPAIEFTGPRILPDNCSIYASVGINLNLAVDSILTTFAPLIRMQLGVQSVDDALTQFESQLGFKIKGELLASLGNEFVISYAPTSSNNPVQSLERVILLTVTNSQRLSEILEKLHTKVTEGGSGGPPVIHKSYKIYPLDDNVSATVVNSFLIISTTEQTKRLIDGWEQGKVLSRNPELLKLMKQKPQHAGAVLYLTNDVFNFPLVKNVFSGTSGSRELVDLARTEYPVPIHGFARTDASGVAITLTSPLGLGLVTDLILAGARFDTPRTIRPDEDKPGPIISYLHLLSQVGQVLSDKRR
jgi:hypothetical protein